MHFHQAYHPVKSDYVFPIAVVEWHVTFDHITKRVYVLPRPPVTLHPNNIDLTDDSPHHLGGTWSGEKTQKVRKINNESYIFKPICSILII